MQNIETDSENVLCYLGPGDIVGEFGLLTDIPRAASAYAHKDIELYWFSKKSFSDLQLQNPDLALKFLLFLSKNLTQKMIQQNQKMSEYLFNSVLDKETDEMIAWAMEAQQEFVKWPENKIDLLLKEIAQIISIHAKELAEINVADTKIGVVEDKIVKINFACHEILETLLNHQGIGFLPGGTQVQEIASPMGVIFGIIPITNPVSTIVFKTLICIKARNALIFSCHRDALHLGNRVGELIQEALDRHKAPKKLIQWISKRSDRKKTAMFMRHKNISFILATGGPSIVQAAYSSGTPAIGVGAGNAPVLICENANLADAAQFIIQSKSFDNGVICGSENNLVVVQSIREKFIEQLEYFGAHILSQNEKEKFRKLFFDVESQQIKREFIGKLAKYIAQSLDIPFKNPPRLLIVSAEENELIGPLGREKLAPVLSLFTVDNTKNGFMLCKQILEQQGIGHTAVIHTRDKDIARQFGLEMPASRILVNASAAQGCIGIKTGLIPSMTLGCGTFAKNSTTDNVTYTNIFNIKRLAFGSS